MTYNSDRLDLIEEVLDRIAQQQEVTTVTTSELCASTQANTQAIAANTQAIAANTQAIAVNVEAISDLRASTSNLHSAAELLLQTVNQHQENFELLVQEIRGLRTENRRILNHIFPQENR